MSVRECEQDCRPSKRICLDNTDETCVRSNNSSQSEILYESGERYGYSPGFYTPTQSQSPPTSSEAGGLNPLTWPKTHDTQTIKDTQYTANETREPATTANLPLFDGTVGESRPHSHQGLHNTGVVDQVCFGMVRLSCLQPLFTYHRIITHRDSFSLIIFLSKYCNPTVGS